VGYGTISVIGPHSESRLAAPSLRFHASPLVAGTNSGPGVDDELTLLLEHFVSRHLLNWLEALSKDRYGIFEFGYGL
jgi:hypothetical protein